VSDNNASHSAGTTKSREWNGWKDESSTTAETRR